MNELSAKIEALLFVATKPMTVKQLAQLLNAQISEVDAAISNLSAMRNIDESGIHVVVGSEGVMLASNPVFADVVAGLAKEEIEPELTRPSLETLTIIAYRGPMTKPEIEAIRGVNCALILRNLLMRGLILEEEDAIKLQFVYSLSSDALRFLGLHSVKDLPEYEELHINAKVDRLLAALSESSSI
ncbi:MAG: SMC-Scp complex subunit ScpB [Patescibacteria group bacterium]|jgi:segregation and condensation protein B